MEKIDKKRSWESDFIEFDDVLDESFFTANEDDGDVEDDEFHEKENSHHFFIDL